MEKKITRAMVKRFVQKNFDNLYIKIESKFDGMTDLWQDNDSGFQPVHHAENLRCYENNFGVAGLWIAGYGTDSFRPYDDGKYSGIQYGNTCGLCVIAIRKAA